MNNLLLLVLASVTLCYMASASTQRKTCVGREGVCTKIEDGPCRKIPGFCKRGFTCCQKEPPKELADGARVNNRKCKTKKSCSNRGGTCVNPKRDNCPGDTIDRLCKGSSCTCCISGRSSKSCKIKRSCKRQGGTCIKRKKSKKLCSSGTIDKKGCKGKKCVCCIPPGNCKCGITNKAQSSKNTKVLYTITNLPEHPKYPNKGMRVVGGTEVTPQNKFPWLVAVKFKIQFDFIHCTGSIINSHYVVTTASCIVGVQQFVETFYNYYEEPVPELNAKNITIGVADFNQNSTNDDIPGVTRLVNVKEFFLHDKFVMNISNISIDSISDNDIALLRLQEPLDLISHEEIKPVCLPVNTNEDYKGEMGVTVGWGVKSHPLNITFEDLFSTPTTPNEVTMPILGPDCDGNTAIGILSITSNTLCAAGTAKECTGPHFWDFGAPLTVERDGRHVLVGLFSSRDGCEKENFLVVYTRVTKYIDWINDIVDGDGSFCE